MELNIGLAEEFLGTPIDDYNSDTIEALESFIIDCNTAASATEGEPLVEDAIYDRLIEILREVKPASGIFNELWDAPDESEAVAHPKYDVHLRAHPMLSIQTVKSWDDKYIVPFLERIGNLIEENGGVNLLLAYKLNGHGVRVVYDDGRLVHATSRARSSGGRNLTRQMRNILGDFNTALRGQGIVEVRGEVVLAESNMDNAREFNPDIKSPFSAVSSLIKPSSSVSENRLLDFIAYRWFDNSDVDFITRESEYEQLEQSGFTIPEYIISEISDADPLTELQGGFRSLEADYEDYPYYCDGVVCEIDDLADLRSLGSEGVRSFGNIALKVDTWKQDLYTGIVQAIIWKRGKTKLSPVAIVADEPNKAVFDTLGGIVNELSLGVMTASGNTVRNVPLYEPKNIMILDAYPGQPLSFKYGGEAGVVPCTDKGLLLKDDALRERILDN